MGNMAFLYFYIGSNLKLAQRFCEGGYGFMGSYPAKMIYK